MESTERFSPKSAIDLNAAYDQTVLANVAGKPISVADLLHHLKLSLNWQVLQDVVTRFYLNILFDEYSIQATEEEIQTELTIFRRTNQLFTSPLTQAWLKSKSLSDEEFFAMCEYKVKLSKLKETLFGNKVEQRFVFQKLDLESVELYRLVADSLGQANELMALINEGGDFFGLARSFSIDATTNKICGYMGLVFRRDLPADVEAKVFGAKEDTIVGPIKTAAGYELYLLEKFHHPILDEETRASILDELFAEFLQQKLSAARIEMFVS